MKSKIFFDLNGRDEAVITASVTYSEDVRDKVAKRIMDNLEWESTLAFVYCVETSPADHNTPHPTHVWEIRTISPSPEGSRFMAEYMSDLQLIRMHDAITNELKRRKDGGPEKNYFSHIHDIPVVEVEKTP
jgi:hypothetical protein